MNWTLPRFWRNRRAASSALTLTALSLALAGCGLQPATAFVPEAGPGSINPIAGAEDKAVTVTGKNYTEALLLDKVAVLTMQAAGFAVTDLANVPGSQPVRNLMVSGVADVAWDYTGTAWLIYMGQEKAPTDPQLLWRYVHDADLGNGITWLPRADMNNTYAMAVRRDAVTKLGNISKLSDIANLPAKDRTFCIEAEFNSRQDGMNGMLQAYGIPRGKAGGVPDDNIGIYDTGAVYSATARGSCNFGEVFTTDGRINALDLTVLKDDKSFFPSYNASINVRSETLDEFPGIADAFAPVTAALSNDVMRELNAKVDVDGQQPADVAFDWMVSQGFISKP